MRSSRNTRWSTLPVVQRRMLLGVQLYVLSTFAFPIFVLLISFSPQYVLPPNSVVYTGCVGDDDLAQQLKAANKKEGLAEAYLVKKGEQTGACAVVITGHHRYFNSDIYSRHMTFSLTLVQVSRHHSPRRREI
jgi:pfkB family carbohydrate kinase